MLPARQTEDECREDQLQTGIATSIKRQPCWLTQLRLRPGCVETSGSCVWQGTANPIKGPARKLYSQVSIICEHRCSQIHADGRPQGPSKPEYRARYPDARPADFPSAFISEDQRFHFQRREIPVPVRTSQAWPRRFNSAFVSQSFRAANFDSEAPALTRTEHGANPWQPRPFGSLESKV